VERVDAVCRVTGATRRARSEGDRAVHAAGIGLVTPLAVGAAETWRRLLAGESGTTRLQADHVPEGHVEAAKRLACQVVAPVNNKAFAAAACRSQVCTPRTRPLPATCC
jgi:3-oxoacyl-(acyl-carrier-protein) synthase